MNLFGSKKVEPEEVKPQTPAIAPPPARAGISFSFGKKAEEAPPVAETQALPTEPEPRPEPVPQPATLSLDVLDALAPLTEPEIVPEYAYPDAVTEYSTDQSTLGNLLNIVKESMDSPELADNVIFVMEQLKSNPETAKVMLPEDIRTMVVACQKAYGIIVQKKSNTKAKKTATSEKVSQVEDLMADLNFASLLGG